MSKAHFPGANTTAQYWAGKFTGSTMNTNCACIHTTEGFSWPSYGGGASAPHLTILPNIATKTVSVRQHFPANKSSRALVNLSGGVETNTLNVLQIELIGTCDSKNRTTWLGRRAGVDYIYWPDAPDWALEAIAPVFQWLDADWPNFKIADTAPRGWVQYPASYGVNAKQRMTFSEWRNAYGIFGHEHVPENSHGDPGNFPIKRLIDFALGTIAPTPEPETPVVWTPREDEYRVDITLPVYGRVAPHVDATKVTDALAVGSVIYATAIITQSDGDWVRSKYGTCFKVSSLTLLGDEPTPEPDPEPGATTYTVLPGDTLASIASRHGLTLAQLLELNGLDIIAPGLVLAVTADTEPEPEPEPEPGPTLKIVSLNLWGYADGGDNTQIERLPRVRPFIAEQKPDIFAVQELSNQAADKKVHAGGQSAYTPLAYLDTKLDLDRFDAGSDGRYVYGDDAVTFVAGDTLDLLPRYKADDKQAAPIVGEKDGVRFGVCSYHLENEGPDSNRIAQAKDMIVKAEAMWDEHSVPKSNRFYCGDANFSTVVRDAFAPAGYVDTAAVAKVKKNVGRRSYSTYGKTVNGARIDFITAPEGTEVLEFEQDVDYAMSDHNAQIATLRLQPNQ